MRGGSTIDTLRSDIEQATLEIIRLVGRRNSLAAQVAREKVRLGFSLVNPEVERNLRSAVIGHCNEIGIEPAVGQRVLNHLIAESIRVQQGAFNTQPSFSSHDIFVQAKEMEQSGRDIIHLEVGEPDFGPPEAVRKALSDAVSRGFTRYTPSVGIPQLRKKIAALTSQQSEREVSPQEVIITVSGKYALYLAFAATIQTGDEVLIIDPSFPAYSRAVTLVGGRPLRVSTELKHSWTVDPEMVSDHITRSTRMIVLNCPSNPTGKVLSRPVLAELTALAEAHGIRLLSDEVYSRYSLVPHTGVLQFPEEDHITVQSFSKLYGMTGFRLGYAVSDTETIKRMARVQHLQLTSAPEFIQHAGLAALDCEEDARRHVATIRSRIGTTVRLLKGLPLSLVPPDGGFYIFAQIQRNNTSGREFAERLLTETGVCVMPGEVYGQQFEDFIRISVCQPEDRLVQAVERIKEVLG